MNNYKKLLEELLSNNYWKENDILRVMTLFRHIIEEKNFQEKYKYLNLYCNWALHPKIDKSSVAFNILELLTDSMISFNRDPLNSMWINDAIIVGLSLHKVQEDIIGLCDNVNIKNNLIDFRNWEKFAILLISKELIEKPIKFSEGIGSKILDSIKCKAAKSSNPNINTVLGIEFIIRDSRVLWRMYTKAQEKKNFEIVGPIAIINQEMVDNYHLPSK